jgi:hypothetical protein
VPLSERKAETRAASDIKAVCRLCAGSRALGGRFYREARLRSPHVLFIRKIQ